MKLRRAINLAFTIAVLHSAVVEAQTPVNKTTAATAVAINGNSAGAHSGTHSELSYRTASLETSPPGGGSRQQLTDVSSTPSPNKASSYATSPRSER